jgi:hypothetical protein
LDTDIEGMKREREKKKTANARNKKGPKRGKTRKREKISKARVVPGQNRAAEQQVTNHRRH